MHLNAYREELRLCCLSICGSAMPTVALNSLLVFVNPSQLLGTRDGTVYLCVVGHTCLSEIQEKLANQL